MSDQVETRTVHAPFRASFFLWPAKSVNNLGEWVERQHGKVTCQCLLAESAFPGPPVALLAALHVAVLWPDRYCLPCAHIPRAFYPIRRIPSEVVLAHATLRAEPQQSTPGDLSISGVGTKTFSPRSENSGSPLVPSCSSNP